MIIYRNQERKSNPRECLNGMLAGLDRFELAGFLNHGASTELLIDLGEFESAVADALCLEEDSDDHVLRLARQAGLQSGRIFYLSWQGRTREIESIVADLRCIIDALAGLSLPETVSLKVPEGYAYYGLYPDMYAEAANLFLGETGARRVVCIGIRSIGTSLSSVVWAALVEMGCEVESFTVRPHGHPFDRRLRLAPELEDRLRSLNGAHFVIVDEGPGLSGSSFCSVAAKLSELGVSDDRIAFFPSWEPDGRGFVSEAARDRWSRHRKYTTSFEDVWLKTGRFARNLPEPAELTDLSAGMWRSLVYEDPSLYPAVHPHHERRKYLWTERPPVLSSGASSRAVLSPSAWLARKRPPLFIKFSGLGRYGRMALDRARKLHDAGFAPPAGELADGFIIRNFVQGRPVAMGDTSRELLDAMAGYLAFIKREFQAERGTATEEIIEMIRTNTREGLGSGWAERIERIEDFGALAEQCEPVALDGRMFPHEWLRTGDGFLNTDGVEHHADHFFPGCQDIAWDIAGCCVEFGLDQNGKDYLIQKYQSLSKDTGIERRLPFWSVAYLAFRLGYAGMAAATLGGTNDGQRFGSLSARYAMLLREQICRSSPSSPPL